MMKYPVCCSVLLILNLASASASDLLVSKPAPPRTAIEAVKPGEKLVTAARERRRVELPGGAQIYLREQTEAKVLAAGVELAQGETLVETHRPITLETPLGAVRCEDGKFGVRLGPKAQIYVLRGSVSVNKGREIASGRLWTPGKDETEPLPRASHLLTWTKELHETSPLVPASHFAGGTLRAADADGQQAKIELRKYHIDVHIEDGFARTTIDQTYFNHEPRQLEGTFYFPLPPDASLSYFAMYVDGNRMEAGMVERERGRNVYETIRHAQRDPALLEWIDGSTFKMRVFPLEPRTEKRIILGYTQRLASL